MATDEIQTFELTLKGYSRFWNSSIQDRQEAPQGTESMADSLVKWINAPSPEAVEKFIDKHDLREHLDEPLRPIQMKELLHEDGVDLYIDDDGDVLSAKPSESEWRLDWMIGIKMLSEALGDVEEEVWLSIEYECPSCGHEWEDTWTCACDATCENCGERDVEAKSWEEIIKAD